MKKSKWQADIFISHSSEDKNLALLLKRLFEDVIGVNVFCTSDIRSIEGGKAWFTQIMTALRRTRVCITILTPASIYSRWIMFESGGAFALAWGNEETLRMIPIVAGGLRKSSLPSPFDLIQAREIRNAASLRQLCREVSNIFSIKNLQISYRVIKPICVEAKKGSQHWSAVSELLAGTRTDESPFNIESLLPTAKKHVFCAGQTLYYLATNSTFRRNLKKWVNGNKERKVQFMICNPDETDAVDAWTVVDQKYGNDLNESVSTFKKWKQKLKKDGLAKRIDIRTTKLVTTSLIVIDPLDDKSVMILTPVVFGKPIGGERPHFVISRNKNRLIFNHYWETYREVFQRARPL